MEHLFKEIYLVFASKFTLITNKSLFIQLDHIQIFILLVNIGSQAAGKHFCRKGTRGSGECQGEHEPAV